MGRRKIEIKMVKDSGSRQVTFSKRRTGLFKKANELATLCAVQIAIIVFSPGGKPFSYGNPTVESVTRRFLNEGPKPKVAARGYEKKKQEAKIRKLNHKLNCLLKQLQAEENKGAMLDKLFRARGLKPLNELSIDELMKRKSELEDLKDRVRRHQTEMEASSSLLLLSRKPVKENAQYLSKKAKNGTCNSTT
ncbi:hypothetical protein Tsubulata_028140 [Turnera subulata]|uniref:MADS-box domain-containing protein n=1 Tax=Turnera subulata TaxID=218843 RepID=A0A9Q0FST3_9ROSI|nr:hypothetical protein Tsubulata_028140 [Turnera subulata]